MSLRVNAITTLKNSTLILVPLQPSKVVLGLKIEIEYATIK